MSSLGTRELALCSCSRCGSVGFRQFVTEREVIGKRFGTFKSEAMIVAYSALKESNCPNSGSSTISGFCS